MAHRWDLRCPPPSGLFVPIGIDPSGARGPTKGQAAGPLWRRSTPGLYVPSTAPATVEQRILEQAQRLPAGGAVTGWAALRLAGGNFFDGLAPDGRTPLPVPLVVPARCDLRPRDGAERHREQLPATDVVVLHGIPCVIAVRALFDAMRRSRDLRPAVRAADMALAAKLVSLTEMETYVRAREGQRGVRFVARALGCAEQRTKSPRETDLRLIWVIDAGLPRPLCNWPVAGPNHVRIGRPDLLCQQHAVVGEYDGFDHASARRRAHDASKEEALRDAGLESFRIVGNELLDVGLVVRRMHAAVRRAEEAARPRRWLVRRDPGPL